MGVDYYECINCCRGISDEFCRIIDIEGYMPVRLCDDCRDYELIAKPNVDHIWIPAGTYAFFAELNNIKNEFDSLSSLQEYIEDNPTCRFGFSNFRNMTRVPFVALSGIDNFQVLHDYCVQNYWNNLSQSERNEENTIYTPKYEWLEKELKNCEAELSSLKEKHELLISLTKTKKQKIN
jgi:hypothetical protein